MNDTERDINRELVRAENIRASKAPQIRRLNPDGTLPTVKPEPELYVSTIQLPPFVITHDPPDLAERPHETEGLNAIGLSETENAQKAAETLDAAINQALRSQIKWMYIMGGIFIAALCTIILIQSWNLGQRDLRIISLENELEGYSIHIEAVE